MTVGFDDLRPNIADPGSGSGDPIPPGGTTKIKVSYDTKRIGGINKSVTIESNAANAAVKIVKIKGNVIKAPSGSPEISPAGPTAK